METGGKFRKKKSNFSIVSNTAIHDPKISLKAKGLYSLIQSYITLENFTLYKGFLKSKCTDGERAFDSGWKELKEKGYLKQYKMRVGGKTFYYEYELLDEPDISTPQQENENVSYGRNVGTNDVETNNVQYTNCMRINNTIKNNIIKNKTNQIISTNDVMDQIGYVTFGVLNKTQVDEIVMLIAEVLNTPDDKTIRISKDNLAASTVKERFRNLNQFHIEYVLECLSNNTTEIVNVKNYLLTALYNAPLTMDTYYQNKYNINNEGE